MLHLKLTTRILKYNEKGLKWTYRKRNLLGFPPWKAKDQCANSIVNFKHKDAFRADSKQYSSLWLFLRVHSMKMNSIFCQSLTDLSEQCDTIAMHLGKRWHKDTEVVPSYFSTERTVVSINAQSNGYSHAKKKKMNPDLYYT